MTATQKKEKKLFLLILERLKVEYNEKRSIQEAKCPFCGSPRMQIFFALDSKVDINGFRCDAKKCQTQGTLEELSEYLGLTKKIKTIDYIYLNEKNQPVAKASYATAKMEKPNFFDFFANRWIPKSKPLPSLYNANFFADCEKIIFVDNEKIAEEITILAHKEKINAVATTNIGSYLYQQDGNFSDLLKNKKIYICLKKSTAEKLLPQRHALWFLNCLSSTTREKSKIIDFDFQENETLDLFLSRKKMTLKKFLSNADEQSDILPQSRLWQDLTRPQKAEEKNDVQIILERLSKNIDLRYNEVLLMPEVKEKYDTDFIPVSKFEFNTIWLNYHTYYSRPKLTNDLLKKLINSTYIENVHPFKQYFESLPAWDKKTDHIKELADTIILQDESEREIFYKYFKKFLVSVGSTATWHRAGHFIFLLIGPGGIGKTEFIKNLVPQKLKNYHNMSYIDFTGKDKDSLRNLATQFLIQIDEFNKYDYKNMEAIKSYVSQSTASFRALYEDNVTSHIRSASFAGTLNREKFLYPDPGNRRYLIFVIEKIFYEMKIDMDKVWAQAYSLLKDGFQYWADDAENKEILTRLEKHIIVSVEQELILRYFGIPDNHTPPEKIKRMTSTEVTEYLQKKSTIPITPQKIGRVLNSLSANKKTDNENPDGLKRWLLVEN